MKLKDNNKNRLNADGETVVCLNRAVTLCVKRAAALYFCRINLECPDSNILLVNAEFRDIAAEILDAIDDAARKHDFITVKLMQESDKSATLRIVSEDERIVSEIPYNLYTGTPKYVIRDEFETLQYEETVDEICRLVEKLHKSTLKQS